MYKKIALATGCVLVAATAVASAKTTLDILGASQSGGMQSLVKAYMAANPDIDIKMDDGGLDKLATMIAAGAPPDIVWMGDGQVETWAKQGHLLDLNPLMKGIGANLDIIPVIKELATVDGKLDFLPLESGTWALFYNKKLFDDGGQSYPTRTWTWTDFRGSAKKLTSRDASGKVARYGHGPMDPWWWGYWVQLDEQAGGTMVDSAFTTAFPNIDPLERAFQFAWDVTWVDQSAPRPNDPNRGAYAIENNNLAMLWHLDDTALGFHNKISPDAWGVAPFPMAPGGRHAAQSFTTGLAIVAGTKHPQEAAQFLAFLNSSDSQRMLFAQDNKLPVSEKDLLNWLLQPGTLASQQLPASFAEVFTIMQQDSVFLPALDNFDDFTGKVETEYVNLLNSNKISPKQAAEQAKQAAQVILDKELK